MASSPSGGGRELVVFTATWYADEDDVRCRACVSTLEALADRGLAVVVVDDSPEPNGDRVRRLLGATGATVHHQTAVGGKGTAFKEAATLASRHDGTTGGTWLCWQEPEKTDMARLWADAVAAADDDTADVLVPRRNGDLFRETYPIEQYHSETYGNLYLDVVARDAMRRDGLAFAAAAAVSPPPPLDWHFGPIAFRASHVNLWTSYDRGDSYDVQVVPIVHAVRSGLRVTSVDVDYKAPEEMKEEEEGDVAFVEKRLKQLNYLDPMVKAAWTDDAYR